MRCAICGQRAEQTHASIIACVQALVEYIEDSERTAVNDLESLESKLRGEIWDVERTANNASTEVDDLKGRVDNLENEL